MNINLEKGISILYDMEINNYIMTRCIRMYSCKISAMSCFGRSKGLCKESSLLMRWRQKHNLKKQRRVLRAKLTESKCLLQQFYDRMNIDENYRNLAPVSYMVKFLQLGITDKLEGDGGLYCLVLNELSIEQFDITLDELSDKSDYVADKEDKIYKDLSEADIKADGLIRNTENCDGNYAQSVCGVDYTSAVAAYISERTTKEASYQNFLRTYNFCNN